MKLEKHTESRGRRVLTKFDEKGLTSKLVKGIKHEKFQTRIATKDVLVLLNSRKKQSQVFILLDHWNQTLTLMLYLKLLPISHLNWYGCIYIVIFSLYSNFWQKQMLSESLYFFATSSNKLILIMSIGSRERCEDKRFIFVVAVENGIDVPLQETVQL